MKSEFDALLAQATCRIFVGDELEGSGSLVSDSGLIITAAEVLGSYRPNEKFELRFSDNKPLRAEVLAATASGISVLQLAEGTERRKPLRLRFQKARERWSGEGRVVVCGFSNIEPSKPLSVNGRIIEVKQLRNRFGDPVFGFKPEGQIQWFKPGAPVFSEDMEAIIGIESSITFPEIMKAPMNQVLTFGEGLLAELGKSELPGLVRLRKAFSPGMDFLTVYSTGAESESALETEEIAGERSESFRYPVGEFHTIAKDESGGLPPDRDTLIPVSDWLHEPSTPSSRIEFRFRLDTKKTGIPFKGSWPGLNKPRDANYPIVLDVDVFSDEIGFITEKGMEKTARRQIQLPGPGPSTVARFPVKLPAEPQQEKLGVIFVLLRHRNELIAGFRVEAALTPQGVQNDQAQTLEHIYLSEKWFTFEGVPLESPSVTIYFRRENDNIRLFVFSGNNALWAETKKDAKGFDNLTRDIYLEIEKLAEDSQQPNYARAPNEAYDICHRGFQIFSALFYGQGAAAAGQVSRSFGDFLSKLPDGSWVTIATDQSSKDFVIPWGMIYDRTPPQAYPGVPEITAFWGARFKLTVQPSARTGRSRGGIGSQPSLVGRVYENHASAHEMITMFQQLKDQGKVQDVTDLKIEDYWLPELLETDFDFVHFFCHGYTKLADDELRQSLARRIQAPSSLMYAADPALGSYIKAQRGLVTFSQLQVKLGNLKGSPIIHLSMCQSAQVSCSGDSFVTLFLERGARAVVGTEGPIPFELAREMDEKIINGLLTGTPLRDAVWKARQELVKKNFLALIYIVYGNGFATLAPPRPAS